jgi:hypothetical protein
MNSKYTKTKLDYLDSLFHDFEIQVLDDYTKSHVAKYLTVLTSGIYEDVFKNFVIELIQKETIGKEVKQFVFKQIDRSLRNPTYKNLTEFLNRFDKDWIKKLSEKIIEENIDALNSIVDNKNLIAHGESSTITFLNIKQNYENSKVIILELDNIILRSDE